MDSRQQQSTYHDGYWEAWERGTEFTFKVAVDVKPGSEFIVCRRVCTDAHQVGQMVPVNNKCLFRLQIPSVGQEGT